MSSDDAGRSRPRTDAPDGPSEQGSVLLDLVAPLWTEVRTQRALGDLSADDLAHRRSTGALLGLQADDGGAFHYPLFQFERREEQTRVKPALSRFMMAVECRDPWSVAVVVKTPAPELDGLTPLEWARGSHSESRLLDYARILSAEFGR